MHSDVPALRLVSWMDVGVRAFLDMTDRSSSTPLKGTRICGHPAASKEAGSGTCAAIDWASRETTRPRTGSLCLTARNQVRDHLHVRADGMSRLAIIILRSSRRRDSRSVHGLRRHSGRSACRPCAYKEPRSLLVALAHDLRREACIADEYTAAEFEAQQQPRL